jgi:23S rRNA (cytosine1962-C5)-methyltransferase
MIDILSPQEAYALRDSGGGMKLERFGNYTLSRPDPIAIWEPTLAPALWHGADALFLKEKSAHQNRWKNQFVDENAWTVSVDAISLKLKLTPFKHTGFFPEQILNWRWFGNLIETAQRPPKVLNLFGYTGGATLYAAARGAQVTHIDASKPSVAWARENQIVSGLENAPIRWIIDDALKFVTREARRGAHYDAIIMDPPSFGRDPKGKVFTFEKDVPKLLDAITKILTPEPLFFLINSYAMGYSPTVLKNLLARIVPFEKIQCGELQIREEHTQRTLPCSIYARYQSTTL